MPDPFLSAKGRLGRAKHHIRALDAAFKRYFKKQPYVRAIELHTDGVSQAHKVKLKRQLPTALTHTTFEALEHLRSALDQTAYAVGAMCGVSRPDIISFPVTDDPAEFENAIRGRLKGCSPEVMALFRSFKAYPGGNDPIVALNQTRRQGFHRLITPVGNATATVTSDRAFLKGGPDPNFPTYVPSPFVWDSEKNEMVYGVVGPGGEFEYQINFTFFIAFGEVEGLAGHAVIPALTAISGAVERVLRTVEAETRKLGLFS